MATIQIPANTTVDVKASTADSFNFAGPNGTLQIEPGVMTSGLITGFAAGDKIHFIQTPITGVSVAPVAGNTEVTVKNGASLVDTLKFQGLSGPLPSLAPDGLGGTVLTARDFVIGVPTSAQIADATQRIIGSVTAAVDRLETHLGTLPDGLTFKF